MTARKPAAGRHSGETGQGEAQANSAPPPVVDYQSIVLTLDHMMTRKDNHRIQKIVMSTQGAVESLVGIMHYYRDSQMLTHSSTLEALQEGAKGPSAYVYTGPANVQIVMGLDVYRVLLTHPSFGNGSELQLSDKLTAFVAQYQQTQYNVRGDMCPLFVITPSLEPIPKE